MSPVALLREVLAALDDARPRKPIWLTAWYWLDRWDDWRERRRHP